MSKCIVIANYIGCVEWNNIADCKDYDSSNFREAELSAKRSFGNTCVTHVTQKHCIHFSIFNKIELCMC